MNHSFSSGDRVVVVASEHDADGANYLREIARGVVLEVARYAVKVGLRHPTFAGNKHLWASSSNVRLA